MVCFILCSLLFLTTFCTANKISQGMESLGASFSSSLESLSIWSMKMGKLIKATFSNYLHSVLARNEVPVFANDLQRLTLINEFSMRGCYIGDDTRILKALPSSITSLNLERTFSLAKILSLNSLSSSIPSINFFLLAFSFFSPFLHFFYRL